MVALPKLPNCCACASLKTGTLIIGSLNLVASVIGILASIGFMAGSTVRAIIFISLQYFCNCFHLLKSKLSCVLNTDQDVDLSKCPLSEAFQLLGPGRPSAGGPRMDRRAVTSLGVVKISSFALRLRRSARRGPDPTAVLIKLLMKKY